MVNCSELSTLSNLLSTISLGSWICAQAPQIYVNYRNKSTEGISPSFLLLWFMGDFLSFTSCLLNDAVLNFQIYLSLFFLCNDITLCLQYHYYNSINSGNGNNSLDNLNEENTECIQTGFEDSSFERFKLKVANPIEITSSNRLSPEITESSSLSSEASSHQIYNSIHQKISKTTCILAASVNVASTHALPTPQKSESVITHSMLNKETIGLILAWACTMIYVSSRFPQLLKNFRRKSVDGISPLLFGSALIGNLTYTLSILTSCAFIFNDPKSGFIWKELPYIIGSAGTIIFDIAYFYQRHIYRSNLKETIIINLEDIEDMEC